MSRTINILAIGGSFVLALGAGLMMQQHEANATYILTAPAPGQIVQHLSEPLPPESHPATRPLDVSYDPVSRVSLPVLTAPDTPQGMAAPAACTSTLTAENRPGAMVALSLSAPCHPNADVVIHHRGMMVSRVTDAQGMTRIEVPALSSDAVFLAAFEDDTGTVAKVHVPEIEDVSRVVLQWQGPVGFELHARGGDAADDIWRGNPTDAFTALGDDGETTLRAEVLSFPQSAPLAVTVEVEITKDNCGQQIAAQSLMKTARSQLRSVDMTITMPGCDAIGDYIVLPNPLAQPRVAAS